MSFPGDQLNTDAFDSAADSPAAARPMLKRLIETVKSIITSRNRPNGIVGLGSDGRMGAEQLPLAGYHATGVTRYAQNHEIVAGGDTLSTITSRDIIALIEARSANRVISLRGRSNPSRVGADYPLLITEKFGEGVAEIVANDRRIRLQGNKNYSVLCQIQRHIEDSNLYFYVRDYSSGAIIMSQFSRARADSGVDSELNGHTFYCQFHAPAHGQVYFSSNFSSVVWCAEIRRLD